MPHISQRICIWLATKNERLTLRVLQDAINVTSSRRQHPNKMECQIKLTFYLWAEFYLTKIFLVVVSENRVLQRQRTTVNFPLKSVHLKWTLYLQHHHVLVCNQQAIQTNPVFSLKNHVKSLDDDMSFHCLFPLEVTIKLYRGRDKIILGRIWMKNTFPSICG